MKPNGECSEASSGRPGADARAPSRGGERPDASASGDSQPADGAPPSPSPVASDAKPGDIIGGYQVIEEIGKGGMSRVYKARQVALDRTVALKILPQHLAGDAGFVDRFEQEARAAAKLDHPNIVRAVDAGAAGHKFYFAMEFVEGSSLEDMLRERGSLLEEEALGIMIQVARGLECAWRSGLVHRDIKPGNILITYEGTAKIVDLGLALEAGSVGDMDDTRGGVGMGTPHYMSPEQVHGEGLDIRGDIFALGVTLYRAVTGEFPFTGEDAVSIIMARFEQAARPANEVRPGVSDEIAQVIATMMSLDRELRYPDPAVLLYDLERLAEGKRPEFAGATETKRRRALEAAQIRRAVEMAPGTVVVRRRYRRELTFVTVGVAFAAALVAAAMLVRDGSPETAPPPSADGKLATEAERLLGEVTRDVDAKRYADVVRKVDEAGGKYLGTPHAPELEMLRRRAAVGMAEDEAAAFYASVSHDLDAGEYSEAIGRMDEASARHAGTSYGPKLASLRAQAATKLEREKRFHELLRLAREELGVGDYGRATDLLIQAKAIRETGEVVRLVEDARALQHLARARDAEGAGKLTEAITLYLRGEKRGGDPHLRRHVVALKRKLALREKLAEADGLAGDGRWTEAKTAYIQALGLASGPEKVRIEEKARTAEREVRYAEATGEARDAVEKKAWREAISHAEAALALKPGDEAAQALVDQARDALGPEPEITNSIGMTFVLVPAGEFVMGSEEGEEDERPVRRAYLDAYYISRYEVTNTGFEQFSPAHRLKWKEFSPADDMPVIALTWEEAMAFCRWLSSKEGIEYRLPTEAEWERAARGTDARVHPWGNEAPAAGGRYRCNYAPAKARAQWTRDGFMFAAPVGSYPAGVSAYGCHDMAGNVWEWCLDWYDASYYRTAPKTNPRGPATGTRRVVRGGSFGNGAKTLRCSNRRDVRVGFFEANVGFRCVRAVKTDR